MGLRVTCEGTNSETLSPLGGSFQHVLLNLAARHLPVELRFLWACDPPAPSCPGPRAPGTRQAGYHTPASRPNLSAPSTLPCAPRCLRGSQAQTCQCTPIQVSAWRRRARAWGGDGPAGVRRRRVGKSELLCECHLRGLWGGGGDSHRLGAGEAGCVGALTWFSSFSA